MFWRSPKEADEEDKYQETVEARHDLPAYISQPLVEYNYHQSEHTDEPPQSNFTISKENVILNMGTFVYLSGHYRNRDTEHTKIQLHIIDKDKRFLPTDIERWRMFRYKERKASPIQFAGSESGIVTLQDSIDQTKYITVSWKEFIENFTPFTAHESSNGQKGSFFTTKDWNVDGANVYPHHRSHSSERYRDEKSRFHHRSKSHH